jgi:hypothetical protein
MDTVAGTSTWTWRVFPSALYLIDHEPFRADVVASGQLGTRNGPSYLKIAFGIWKPSVWLAALG